MNEEKTKYTSGDRCSHCKGRVSGHAAGDRVVYWCDDCGSNNPSTPPNVKIDMSYYN